ncbi:cyclin L family cyclin [Schizosaccharomyces japonicus yFS275]|uniref:Cyclin L family cyclin n=1 Tax=Schizosaccharomyces japonicus (strain yFS275 / FY16936) TaxID=402676 RepID=B6JX46_SCHJY|nr:cyclin L family cyclin [Schizosaccharomyces japonicus yFS275]EEB05947.1 cyclin L family cyclin [Schizosaccharomyces japonicus yFS275]
MANSLVHVLATREQLAAFDEKEDAERVCLIGSHWIQVMGVLLELRQRVVGTSLVLFRRYCTLRRVNNLEVGMTALTCLLLGCKAAETAVSIKQLCTVGMYVCGMDKIEKKETDACTAGGTDATENTSSDPFVLPSLYDELLLRTTEELLRRELVVLEALNFELHVVLPHALGVQYLQTLGLVRDTQFVQTCWNLMNDALRTRLCVSLAPFCVAVGCVALAARIHHRKLPDEWYRVFDATVQDTADVEAALTAMYSAMLEAQAGPSKPAWMHMREVEYATIH